MKVIESKLLKENCKVEILEYGSFFYVRLVDLDTGHSPGHRSYKTLAQAKRYFKTFN